MTMPLLPDESPKAMRDSSWRRVLVDAARTVVAIFLGVLSFFTWALANILACGIYGCSGGGFGPSYGRWYQVVGALALGSLALFLAAFVSPLHERGVRVVIGAVLAAGNLLLWTPVILSQIPHWGF